MAVAKAKASWDALFDELLSRQDELGRRVREAMQAQLPAYRQLSSAAALDNLDSEVRLEVERVLHSARAGRAALDDRELAELAAIGERRAQQGVPVADMLRAWRIGVEVVVAYAREVGGRLSIDDAEVLEFVQSTLAWSDVAMVTVAGAHRQAELALAIAAEEERAMFVRGVLFGTIPATELRIRAEAHGLDPAAEYVAVRARLDEEVPPLKREQVLGFSVVGQRCRGLAAVVDGGFAGFLIEPPPRDVDGVVGFGPPRLLEHLAESYGLAARALMTAEACGYQGAHDISSLGLRAAVAMDKQVGESLRKRYLEPLEAGGSAGEIAATLRAYLACGMRVEPTATKLFVHHNTVRYRLARFEELTGTSLRETEVLFELWWALEFSTMRL
jgi:hypothetical protein